MGTNYYMIVGGGKPCPTCGHVSEPAQEIHIGKSSAGWCFSLHANPEVDDGWDGTLWDLERWQQEWNRPDVRIEDEYGSEISRGEMLSVITERGRVRAHGKEWPSGWWKSPLGSDRVQSEEDFHAVNQSQRGPGGLLRHRTGRFCAKHGEGTWDLIIGDFS